MAEDWVSSSYIELYREAVCDVGPICSQHTRVVILSSVMPASLLLNVTVAVVRPPFDRWFYTVVFVVVVVVCSFFVCLPARPSLPTCPSSPPTWPASLRHVTLLMPTPHRWCWAGFHLPLTGVRFWAWRSRCICTPAAGHVYRLLPTFSRYTGWRQMSCAGWLYYSFYWRLSRSLTCMTKTWASIFHRTFVRIRTACCFSL